MLNTASGPSRWRLADHVRACVVDDQVILLDLQRNKYLALGGRPSRGLAQLIDSWPATDAASHGLITSDEANTLIAPLLRQGLLTRERSSTAMTTQLAEPRASLEDGAPNARAAGWCQSMRLLHSAMVTALWLRNRSLGDIAASLTARRTRRAGGLPASGATSIEDAVAMYVRLRSFVFTAHDRCLHDSLALAHFLAGEGLSPTWVVGVRTQPFGAHAWVQHGAVVLNDLHEHVRRFHPILVV